MAESDRIIVDVPNPDGRKLLEKPSPELPKRRTWSELGLAFLVENAFLWTYLFLDFLDSADIYNKNFFGRICLFCWLVSSGCTTLSEILKLFSLLLEKLADKLEKLVEKLEKHTTNEYMEEQYKSKRQMPNVNTPALVKAVMNMVVAVGLLQLAPNKVTPRVTGAFAFASTLFSCYKVHRDHYIQN